MDIENVITIESIKKACSHNFGLLSVNLPKAADFSINNSFRENPHAPLGIVSLHKQDNLLQKIKERNSFRIKIIIKFIKVKKTLVNFDINFLINAKGDPICKI